MKLKAWSGGLALLPAALILTSGMASASPLFGQFGVTGPGVLVFRSGNADFLQFCTDANATASGCTSITSNGEFDVTGPGTNSFTVLGPTDVGTVLNTTDFTPPAAPFTYLPVGVPVTLDNYLTIASKPTWDFQANILPPASCAGGNTASQACFGPFQLNANNGNVNVFLNVFGTLINTADNSKSTLNISFSATYNNTDIATIISKASSAAGAFNPSWAATITATAPEPNTALTMLLAGGSLVGLSRFRRRKQ